MSNLLNASQDVQALAAKFKNIVALGEYLATLGSLENIESEIKARIEKVKGDEKKARDMQKIAEADLITANTDLANARGWRDSTIQDAKDEAARIEAKAMTEGSKIMDEAKANAEQFGDHFLKVKQESVDLEAQIVAKNAELQAVEEKIEKAKAKVAKFLKE